MLSAVSWELALDIMMVSSITARPTAEVACRCLAQVLEQSIFLMGCPQTCRILLLKEDCSCVIRKECKHN